MKISDFVYHNYFENTMIFLIVVSSILIALENPLEDPHSLKNYWLNIIDVTFSSVFVIESIFKIIALGFIFNGP